MKKTDPLHVTSLDGMQISLSVKEEEAFQLVNPELLMYVLYKRAPVAIVSGVYDETELDDTKEQCVEHGYSFGNYLSRATRNKKSGDGGVKEKGTLSSTKKENKHKRTKTDTSASKDADFLLVSTWNMFTETGRGSLERKLMVEDGILYTLALTEEGKVIVKNLYQK